MKAAIDVETFAGAEWEGAVGDREDGFRDVVRGAPAVDRGQAFGEHGVVFFLHAAGHVGGDDARANFENVDAMFGQARGEELGHHGKAGFGNAIIAARNGSGIGADRGDRDDLAAGLVGIFGGEIDHPARHGLGEEVRPFDIDRNQTIEAFFLGLEQIDAFGGSHAGIVDEEVDATEGVAHFLNDAGAIFGDGDVATAKFDADVGAGAFLGRFARGVFVGAKIDQEIPTRAGEGAGDAASDPARAACD